MFQYITDITVTSPNLHHLICVEFWECQEQYKEPSGYPPRSYGAITSPEGKIYKTQQRDDSGPGKSPAWHHRCVPSFRPIRFILWEFPGNILNEWLLIKNTSVAIDWNEPYYTSDEGLCCSCLCFVFCWNHVNPCYMNMFFVDLMLEHMCFLLATLAACKGLLRCVPALQMNFMRVNSESTWNSLSTCWLILYDFVIFCSTPQVVSSIARCLSILNSPSGPVRCWDGWLSSTERHEEWRMCSEFLPLCYSMLFNATMLLTCVLLNMFKPCAFWRFCFLG